MDSESYGVAKKTHTFKVGRLSIRCDLGFMLQVGH